MIEIPNSVTTIHGYILNECHQLNRVIAHGNNFFSGDSLANLVTSLCDRDTSNDCVGNCPTSDLLVTGQACIEGSGTRATAIIDAPENTCDLINCSPEPEAPEAPEAPEESDDSGPSTGVMVGVIVGGTLGTALVGTLIYNFCVRGGASVGKEVGKVGSLLF